MKQRSIKPYGQSLLFKYAPYEKRKVGKKGIDPVREIMNSLVTSYTFLLRRID